MDPIARSRGLASSRTDIASGNRSACLNQWSDRSLHRPSDRQADRGRQRVAKKLIRLRGGLRLRGWGNSDTRYFHVGSPSSRFLRFYARTESSYWYRMEVNDLITVDPHILGHAGL